MVHDAGYEEEQLVEWGLARHALQNPPERISVGLRAKREPLDLHRAARERSDPLPPPPGAVAAAAVGGVLGIARIMSLTLRARDGGTSF